MNSNKKENELVICPHCKQKVPKTRYCISCGGEIASSPSEEAKTDITTVICPSCQKNVPTFPYCINCGHNLAEKVDKFFVVEMSCGQMIDDVKLSIECRKPVCFYGRTGGEVPTEEEIINFLLCHCDPHKAEKQSQNAYL